MRLALGAGAAVVVVGGALIGVPILRETSPDTPTEALATTPEAATPESATPEAAMPEAATPEAETALPPTDTALPDVPAEEPAPAAPAAPVFDVVRIEPDGTGLVAGQAPAGVVVEILLDNRPIIETRADTAGK